jgi:ATP-dependent Clp protease ATP-binding subunit ClpC
MWQTFSEEARKVVFFAQDEAVKIGGEVVFTEHFLLGLLREDQSVASRVLDRMSISPEEIRTKTLEQLAGGASLPVQEMSLSEGAKRLIDLAYDEARILKNKFIGTEHLLLALLRVHEELAGQNIHVDTGGRILNELGVTLDSARTMVAILQSAEWDA